MNYNEIMAKNTPEIPEYIRGLQTAALAETSRPRVILGKEAIITPDADPDDLTAETLAKIRRDVRKGRRTREMMDDYGLTWSQLRPIIELFTAPTSKAARRKRIALLAMESAEALAERMTEETDNLKPKDIANTIAKLATTAAALDGDPTHIVEHRHTIDIPAASRSLEELRQMVRVTEESPTLPAITEAPIHELLEESEVES